ncbi:MAG: pyruvate ferredoxin oxidoreductase, partial [Candidatus Bathyarchaeia archaeon]
MQKLLMTGNRAVAEGVKLSKVNVVAAYPITPQTPIVENLSQLIANGVLKAQMVHVESEHSAMSACIGASLVGARVFTASSSQGLALMNECLFAASGLRLPIVMAVVNRALSQPPSIYCDHQDSLAVRDSGWIQFYVETCQEALDTILIAYRVAENERVLLPAMVCLDGFYLSHLSEPIDVPDEDTVNNYLPTFTPKYPILDVNDPKTIGTVPSPQHYTEFKYDMHRSMAASYDVINNAFKE